MSTNFVKLTNNLEILDLLQIKNNLNYYAEQVSNKKISFVDGLYELSNIEVKFKKERAQNACVKIANFPFIKTLNDFDFSFQPSLDKEKILDLASLRFIENRENLLFLGPPGVGKTHISTSIGIEAASARYSTYFIHFNDLISGLKKSLLENRFENKLKNYAKYKVLIIDEVGYLPVDIESANLFFQLISKRYEKHCTIITTNKSFTEWSEIFGDSVLANAILDRLLHHSHVVNINGRSYRTKKYLEFSENND